MEVRCSDCIHLPDGDDEQELLYRVGYLTGIEYVCYNAFFMMKRTREYREMMRDVLVGLNTGFQQMFKPGCGAAPTLSMREFNKYVCEAMPRKQYELKKRVTTFLESTPEISIPFMLGFSDGIDMIVRSPEQLEPKRTKRFRTYEFLLENWEHIETLRTRIAIYEFMKAELKLDTKPQEDGFEAFDRLCSRIGLKRPVGRPRKIRTKK